MKAEQNPGYEYQLGGSLPVDAPTYVVRQADQDIYEGLKTGDFCYVLNSRQMGKSSLRVQAMKRLQGEGINCAVIDLTEIGSQNLTPDQWYAGIVRTLVRNFQLSGKFNLRTWWREREFLSPVQRLSEFIEELLLVEVDRKIVIFIDEIDSVLNLNFGTDDFFALIRFWYNQRVDKPAYKRLTFCLLGVATPSDLIKDKKRTPFNIGRDIELKGFQLQEAEPLAKGLVGKVSNPQAMLKEVLVWTGGQPFLTQKLLKLILASDEKLSLEAVIKKRIIENWEAQDEPEHLRTIRDRIFRDKKRAGRLLGLYQKILQQGEVAADESPEQIELRLSGLVVERHGKLRVYNPIYKSVFSQTWVDKELADFPPYSEAITAWLASNCTDESRLLYGQALRDAQVWAEGRNLSNDDYQFLNASQAEAWKFLSFKFRNGAASDISELINLCDQYPEEAEDYLFNSYLEGWLVNHLGRTDLGNISRNIVPSYEKQKRKGLEMFVRELCKSVGTEPYPKIFAQPDRLDFGEIPVGYKTRLELKIDNNGRGFAWGYVVLKDYLPGVNLPDKFNSLIDHKIDIDLDTLMVKPGIYQGYIVISLEGIQEALRIPLQYKVKEIRVLIQPSQINWGLVRYGRRVKTTLLRVKCEPSTARIKGTASATLRQLAFEPSSFEGSYLEIGVNLDQTLLASLWLYKGTISLETNTGTYQIPIKFRTNIRWENLLGFIGVFLLLTLFIMGLTLIFHYFFISFKWNLYAFFVYAFGLLIQIYFIVILIRQINF